MCTQVKLPRIIVGTARATNTQVALEFFYHMIKLYLLSSNLDPHQTSFHSIEIKLITSTNKSILIYDMQQFNN